MDTLISRREFHGDEAFEIEAAGAKAGINPMFGGWSQRFDFAPVPHRGTGGAVRRTFQDAIRAQLTNKFAFWGEVQVSSFRHPGPEGPTLGRGRLNSVVRPAIVRVVQFVGFGKVDL